MKKYSLCLECLDKNFSWLARPWIFAGAVTYEKIADVPADSILISIWPAFRSPVKEWAAAGNSYIEIDMGYWGLDTPRRDTKRVTYNNSHNLNMLSSVPYSRKDTLNPPVLPWNKRKGDYVLIIEPNPNTMTERKGINMSQWREMMLDLITPHWKGEIKWRVKKGGKNRTRWKTFVEDVKNCQAVVGERTNACAEAIMLGCPAYTIDDTITTLLMGKDLSQIANPIYPDRDAWIEHVAWSQFHNDEFNNGSKIAELVEQYQINPYT